MLYPINGPTLEQRYIQNDLDWFKLTRYYPQQAMLYRLDFFQQEYPRLSKLAVFLSCAVLVSFALPGAFVVVQGEPGIAIGLTLARETAIALMFGPLVTVGPLILLLIGAATARAWRKGKRLAVGQQRAYLPE